jgi:hypothetical protein
MSIAAKQMDVLTFGQKHFALYACTQCTSAPSGLRPDQENCLFEELPVDIYYHIFQFLELFEYRIIRFVDRNFHNKIHLYCVKTEFFFVYNINDIVVILNCFFIV